MTSNDVPPGSGATAGRRRALGRGPVAPQVERDDAAAPVSDGTPVSEAPRIEPRAAGTAGAEVAGSEAADDLVVGTGVADAEAGAAEVAGAEGTEAAGARAEAAAAGRSGSEVVGTGAAVVEARAAETAGAGTAEVSGAEGAEAAGAKASAIGAGAAAVVGAVDSEAGTADAVDARAGTADAEAGTAEVSGAEGAEATGAGAEVTAEEIEGAAVVEAGTADAEARAAEVVGSGGVGAGVADVEAGAAEAVGPAGVEGVGAGAGYAEVAQGGVVAAEGSAGGGESDGGFKVRLANFEGPFDLLLQLISKHKLDVTEVALSKVTDEFMTYIRAMGPDWDLDETTEFLVVAATLLDLKAARLLPAAQVEDEADLALLEARDLLFARLLQYRAYKQIADIFNRRLDEEAWRYPRTVGLEPHHAELLPEVVISIGPEGFAKLAVKAMQPKPKPQVYVDHIHAPLVSVQEQAGIVVARLRELGEASFRLLVEDADGTLTVVARFLALLELYREKAVALDQETALGELLVRWTGGEGEAEPVVTDEFDRPPEPLKEEKA